MNSTQARTCGVAFWNTRQPIHARRRKRVWETSGLAHHQGWLVENLTAGAHQRRMASVSSEKRAAESHLVAVFKKHKETTVTGIATRRSFHLGALHGLPYRVEFSGVDMTTVAEKLGFSMDSQWVNSKVAGGSGTLVLAYAVHKLFTPVRMGITLSTTPILVRWLRRNGVWGFRY
ncbi:protein FAM210B, mitochondrial isoform X2 [Rhipicephalus microplus]|uniref:protein FAM210B, mitochondrial isoform X2 n=1 Tax=Rhipicephalus microplus TaxID=6941 RepID=UPI003F6CF877